MIEKGINCPLASSAGRLFDAVSALTGIQQTSAYEGQAAIRLEAVSLPTDRVYPYGIDATDLLVIDPRPMIREIVDDLLRGVSVGEIAGAFHNTFVAMLAEVARRVADETGIARVALSGGTFQNEWVLTRLSRQLIEIGLEPITHQSIPCNDGGLSLGQAVIAAASL